MATFVLTYCVTLTVAVIALALDGFGRGRSGLVVTIAGLTASAAAGLGAGVMRTAGQHVGSLEVGGPASMVYGVIALVGLAAVLGGLENLAARPSGASIAALIAFGVATSGAVAASTDLITLLLVLESTALVSYALVSAAGTPRAGEAAIKYFVQGALAAALLLFGVAVFVGAYVPSGRYEVLAGVLGSPKLLSVALAATGLVIASLAFKMAAFPFHSWAPDAYETAPPEAAAFLAAGPKLATFAAAAVFVSIVSYGAIAQRVLVVTAILAILSIAVGSVAALRQQDYRRLLAYAGIAQAGFALIAVALATPPLAVFFGATYALAAAGTFLAASEFRRLRPEWNGSVAGLAGLGREAPLLSGSVAILLISLAGVPPFLGFWGKFLIFLAGISGALQNGRGAPVASTVVIIAVSAGVIGSVVSLGFYGSILRTIYFEKTAGVAGSLTGETRAAMGPAGISVVTLAVVVVVLGLLPLVMGSTVIYDLFVAR